MPIVVALTTQYSYSCGEGFANGDASRFLSAEGFTRPDGHTIPRLMSILDEEDTTDRRAAVKALGAIGHDAVPVLVEALLHRRCSRVTT